MANPTQFLFPPYPFELRTVPIWMLACIWATGLTVEVRAQDHAGDKQALVALYNATDGANWTNNENWLSEQPLDDWHGVTVSDGRVTELHLYGNQLTGPLPTELGNLTSLTELDLSDNQLTGTLPDSFARLRALASFRFDGNSGLCADAAIQTWLGGIDDVRGPHCSLSESTSECLSMDFHKGHNNNGLPEKVEEKEELTGQVSGLSDVCKHRAG